MKAIKKLRISQIGRVKIIEYPSGEYARRSTYAQCFSIANYRTHIIETGYSLLVNEDHMHKDLHDRGQSLSS